MTDTSDSLTIGLAQIAPVWLNRDNTIEKITQNIEAGSKKDCELIVFGEALIPGYPFWVDRTGGASFNSPVQKEIYAHYFDQAVSIPAGHLDPICKLSKDKKMAAIIGCIERAADRGNHSLYCALVYIDNMGQIGSVHRKLMPTYEERLVWGIGDGHGLQVHNLKAFTVGALNCWENWMPLVRSALYGMGEDLHVAIWPGNDANTRDITRFIARESRSYVVSVGGLMRKKDITSDIPHSALISDGCPDIIANGGSCIAGPDGEWIIEPQSDSEELITASLDYDKVRQERHNFDPSGHYSRPDVTQLTVNRERQSTIRLDGE